MHSALTAWICSIFIICHLIISIFYILLWTKASVTTTDKRVVWPYLNETSLAAVKFILISLVLWLLGWFPVFKNKFLCSAETGTSGEHIFVHKSSNKSSNDWSNPVYLKHRQKQETVCSADKLIGRGGNSLTGKQLFQFDCLPLFDPRLVRD